MILSDGSKMQIAKIYPLDAVFDTPADVPEDVKTNKRYAGLDSFTISECAAKVKADSGVVKAKADLSKVRRLGQPLDRELIADFH